VGAEKQLEYVVGVAGECGEFGAGFEVPDCDGFAGAD